MNAVADSTYSASSPIANERDSSSNHYTGRSIPRTNRTSTAVLEKGRIRRPLMPAARRTARDGDVGERAVPSRALYV